MSNNLAKTEEAKNLIQGLITKSWRDNDFKKEFVNSPLKVIKNELSEEFTLNENLNLIVEDQTDPNIIYLNIPKQTEVLDEHFELSDEQLEMVSGGEAVVAVTIGVVASVITIGYFLDDVIDGANQYYAEKAKQ